VITEIQVNEVQKETKAIRGLMVRPAHRVLWALWVPRENKDSRVFRVPRVEKETRVIQVLRVQEET
jgi:hypothetical protein